MRCENCIDIEEVDGVEPECKTDRGCPVPPLSADELRILEMRGLLMQLKGLLPADAVLRMHGATIEDLMMLAVVEEGLKEKK